MRLFGGVFSVGLAIQITPLVDQVYIDRIIWFFCIVMAAFIPLGGALLEKAKKDVGFLNLVSVIITVSVFLFIVVDHSAHVQAGNVAETPVGPSATKTPTPTPPPVSLGNDYDDDDNGLIDIRNVNQLQAMRYDLFPTGTHSPTDRVAYERAFPNPRPQMGCPTTGCIGYELRRNVNILGLAWVPIGPNSANPFEGRLEGNGWTIQDFVHDDADAVSSGLFAYLGDNAIIRDLKFTDSVVRGKNKVGTLAGEAGAALIESCLLYTSDAADE